MFAVAVLGILLSSVETVRSIENPYLTISKRNAFNLTSEPPPGPKSAPEPPKSEDIKLTGIYRHEGVERAALALIDTKKKAEPPNYLQLAAGEKKDGIEIVSIDKATGKVTIREFGELRSLSFEEDAFKTSVTKAPRKTSSRSSSSKSSSSSAAAKKAAEIRASIEKKRAEEAAKRSRGGGRSSGDELRERITSMSDADRQKYVQQMRERFSSQGRGDGRSDRGDRGGDDGRNRGSDSRPGRGR